MEIFSAVLARMSFGDVRRNGNRCSLHLIRQPIEFVPRKRLRQAIDLLYQVHPGLPDSEIAKAVDRFIHLEPQPPTPNP
jgi:hypothetical protein